MLPNQRRLEARRRRLLAGRPWVRREAHLQRQLYAETRNPRYLALTGRVESTFAAPTDADVDAEDTAIGPITSSATNAGELAREEQARERARSGNTNYGLNHASFARGKWMFDTPGVVSEDQVSR